MTTSGGARRVDRQDDSGSALVLALLVILVVGGGLAIALDYTGVGLTLAPAVRDDRNKSNYAQGSVEGAINQIRGSSELGRGDVASCPTYTPPVPSGLSGVTGHTFTVTCSGQATGGSTASDSPRFAIHSLGTASGEGIVQDQGNGQLYINGGIYSSGGVTANNTGQASVRVNGTITARQGCTGNITTTDPIGKNCSAGASAFDTAPDYDHAFDNDAGLQSVIAAGTLQQGADPVPTCAGTKAEFEPGYYSVNPQRLLARVLPTCSATVFAFNPGRYYFDYDGVWDLGANKIIAGTYVSSTLGSSCSWDDTDPRPGAQFVFGGTSAIYTQSSSGSNTGGLELCGPQKNHTLNGNPQRIALYALSARTRDGLASPVPTALPSVIEYANAPTSTGNRAFISPGNARTIDGVLRARTPLNFNANNQSVLQYGTVAASVTKGAVLTTAEIDVAHTLGTRADARLTLSWGSDTEVIDVGSNACTTTSGVRRCNILDILEDRDVPWRALSEMSLTYTVTARSNANTATALTLVDGVRIQVMARAPGLRASACATGNACKLIQSASNPNLFFHGTVFAPTAALDVWIHNSGETIFDRGVIVRTININMNSSSKQESSPFQVPSATPDGRLVLFIGKVDNVEKVRACVRYVDKAPVPATGLDSAYAGWSLNVLRWNVLRTASQQPASCS